MAFRNLVRTVVGTARSVLTRGLKIIFFLFPRDATDCNMTHVVRSRYSSVVNTADRWDTLVAARGADVWGNWGGPPGQQRPGGGKMHIISENTLCCARNKLQVTRTFNTKLRVF